MIQGSALPPPWLALPLHGCVCLLFCCHWNILKRPCVVVVPRWAWLPPHTVACLGDRLCKTNNQAQPSRHEHLKGKGTSLLQLTLALLHVFLILRQSVSQGDLESPAPTAPRPPRPQSLLHPLPYEERHDLCAERRHIPRILLHWRFSSRSLILCCL